MIIKCLEATLKRKSHSSRSPHSAAKEMIRSQDREQTKKEETWMWIKLRE
jgi:hypothetical protein